MNWDMTEAERLMAAGQTHLLYKDSEGYLKKTISIFERNAKCPACGEKEMKVTNWEKREAICKKCGYSMAKET